MPTNILYPAKMKKVVPPAIATVLWDIWVATSLPPHTAIEVQIVCPMQAPSVTAYLYVIEVLKGFEIVRLNTKHLRVFVCC